MGLKKVKKTSSKKNTEQTPTSSKDGIFMKKAVNHQAPIEQVFVLEEFVDKIKIDAKVSIVSPEVLAEISDSKKSSRNCG